MSILDAEKRKPIKTEHLPAVGAFIHAERAVITSARQPPLPPRRHRPLRGDSSTPMGGARALRQGGHGACPMTPAAPAPAPAMATTLSSLRRKRGNEGECSESIFLCHATKKDSPCSAASLRAAALVVARQRRAESDAPQHHWRASLRLRARAEGGESSPGGRAAPSSSVAMGVVMRMVMEDLGRVRRPMAWGRPAEVRGGGDV